MFKEADIKIFSFEDLINKTLKIKSFKDELSNLELIIAKDIKTGDIFVIKEIYHLIEKDLIK